MDTRAMQPQPAAGTSIKLIIGAFLAVLGVVLTLDNVNVIDSEPYLAWWPLVIVLIGTISFLGDGSRAIGAGLVVVGAWLTAYNQGLVRFTLFDLWPLILIAGGVVMVARSIGFVPRSAESGPSSTLWGVFGVRKVRESSREFAGRTYVGLLGGCEVDLTDAEIGTSPAIIETFAFWAGIEIVVPDHWEVIGEVVPIMAGFEVNVRSVAAPQKRLVVRGTAIMAGVEIKSAPGRAS